MPVPGVPDRAVGGGRKGAGGAPGAGGGAVVVVVVEVEVEVEVDDVVVDDELVVDSAGSVVVDVSGPVVVVVVGSVVVVDVEVLDVVVVGGGVTVKVASARSPPGQGGLPLVQAVTMWSPTSAFDGTVKGTEKPPLLGLTVAEPTSLESK
jgi:hypothetical protein